MAGLIPKDEPYSFNRPEFVDKREEIISLIVNILIEENKTVDTCKCSQLSQVKNQFFTPKF